MKGKYKRAEEAAEAKNKELVEQLKGMNFKIQHGGARSGAGRKKKEETETTGFRLNSEALNICRKHYGRTLNAKVNDYIKSLAAEVRKGSG